jgi:hypothetical protein
MAKKRSKAVVEEDETLPIGAADVHEEDQGELEQELYCLK